LLIVIRLLYFKDIFAIETGLTRPEHDGMLPLNLTIFNSEYYSTCRLKFFPGWRWITVKITLIVKGQALYLNSDFLKDYPL